MSIPAMSFYICSILKHHCAWDWRRWVGVVEGRQTLYVACGGCYHWCTLYKKRNNTKGLFIYIVTKSCFVDNKIIMNLILFLVSFISCMEAFYNREKKPQNFCIFWTSPMTATSWDWDVSAIVKEDDSRWKKLTYEWHRTEMEARLYSCFSRLQTWRSPWPRKINLTKKSKRKTSFFFFLL